MPFSLPCIYVQFLKKIVQKLTGFLLVVVDVVFCVGVKYLTLRDEHRLRVFMNVVLMNIFGPKKNNRNAV